MSEDEEIDTLTIFDLIRDIKDPEFPNTLEELGVLCEDWVSVEESTVTVQFKPTIPHCSLAIMIGLCLHTKLEKELQSKYKVDVIVLPGSHEQEEQVNKQIGDKERREAAYENPALSAMVDQCLAVPDY